MESRQIEDWQLSSGRFYRDNDGRVSDFTSARLNVPTDSLTMTSWQPATPDTWLVVDLLIVHVIKYMILSGDIDDGAVSKSILVEHSWDSAFGEANNIQVWMLFC